MSRERPEPEATRAIATPIGAVVCSASATGVTRIWMEDAALSPEAARGPSAAGRILADLLRELEEYFAGRDATFRAPLAPAGTAFQRTVWEALVLIPPGQTRSYADIAAAIGRPTAVRAVARANATNPISLLVPCHRVIGSDGTLTGYGGGLERKRWLLEHERRWWGAAAVPAAPTLFASSR